MKVRGRGRPSIKWLRVCGLLGLWRSYNFIPEMSVMNLASVVMDTLLFISIK